jgi:hypothetical protein
MEILNWWNRSEKPFNERLEELDQKIKTTQKKELIEFKTMLTQMYDLYEL